jgi:hypothetical protein
MWIAATTLWGSEAASSHPKSTVNTNLGARALLYFYRS